MFRDSLMCSTEIEWRCFSAEEKMKWTSVCRMDDLGPPCFLMWDLAETLSVLINKYQPWHLTRSRWDLMALSSNALMFIIFDVLILQTVQSSSNASQPDITVFIKSCIIFQEKGLVCLSLLGSAHQTMLCLRDIDRFKVLLLLCSISSWYGQRNHWSGLVWKQAHRTDSEAVLDLGLDHFFS